jgi:hypothetical protein
VAALFDPSMCIESEGKIRNFLGIERRRRGINVPPDGRRRTELIFVAPLYKSGIARVRWYRCHTDNA